METGLFRPGFVRRWVVSFVPSVAHWFEPFPEVYQEPYAFTEPDSDENIAVAAREGRLAGWIAGNTMDIPLVRSATFSKLVERVTFHAYYDQELTDTFLLSYLSFSSGPDLLRALIKRYHVKREGVTDEEELEKANQIQLRVLNFIKQWVRQYWIDFAKNPELAQTLKTFVFKKAIEIDEQPAGVQVAEAIVKAEADWITAELPAGPVSGGGAGVVTATAPGHAHHPQTHVPSSGGSISSLKKASDNYPEPANINALLLTIDVREFAEQLTLIHGELFYQISPDEFVNKVWKKANHGSGTDNLDKMIDAFNQTSNWIQTSILHGKNLDERVALLKMYVKLAAQFKELNNFNGIMMIQAALESAGVHRLKKTWEGLSKEKQKLFEDTVATMAYAKNFGNYRALLHKCQPPCLPYVGLYITDLTFICDGNDDHVSKKGSTVKQVNVEKRRMMSRATAEIKQYQNAKYAFEPKADLQSLILLAHGTSLQFTEQMLYQLSLQVEPRPKSTSSM